MKFNASDNILADFISELQRKNVKLWVDNGNLRFKAPKGVVTEEY
jgi:hypothetical protein